MVLYIRMKRGSTARIFKVKAVDTTAAGDTFTGYFISSIIDGLPVQDGLELAAKASAIAVSRPGATASIPLRSEVVKEKVTEKYRNKSKNVVDKRVPPMYN